MGAGKGVLPPGDVLVPPTRDWTVAFAGFDVTPPAVEVVPVLVRDAHGGGAPLDRLATVVLLI